jgi:ABC-type sugar transport system permease subunit
MLYQTYLSLTRWDMLAPTKTFVGLENYANMLGAWEFWGVLFNTFYFTGAVVAGSIVLGLAVAILLNQKLRGRNLVRSVTFAPVILSGAAVGLVWAYIFDPNYGLMRTFLGFVGPASPDWLADTRFAMPALIIVYLWKSLGFAAVIYLAGLQNISRDLYEAARVDGANSWVSFRHVTLPQLSPVTFFVGSGNTSTLNFASEMLEEVEGMSIRNEAMLPHVSAGFAATVGRLLGSDNGAKGSALA